MEHPAVARCALTGAAGDRLLAVEPAPGAGRLWPDELLRRLRWAGIDRVIRLRRLPLDRRHNAKIDYPALRRLLAANDKSASRPGEAPLHGAAALGGSGAGRPGRCAG